MVILPDLRHPVLESPIMIERYAYDLRGLVWNIRSGGFDTYDTHLEHPAREKQIVSVIQEQKRARGGLDFVSLIDTYRWSSYYGGNQSIAKHLRFNEALYLPVDDERLNATGGEEISLVFATDEEILEHGRIDLGNRQALRTVLGIGATGLQFATVYLDDINEAVRIKQIHGLFAGLAPMPTVIAGDFNLLRQSLDGAALRHRLGDKFVRMASALLSPFNHPYATTWKELNKRQAYPLFAQNQFIDADREKKRPTVKSRFPLFGVDYAFHSGRAKVYGYKTISSKGGSDHKPAIMRVRLDS